MTTSTSEASTTSPSSPPQPVVTKGPLRIVDDFLRDHPDLAAYLKATALTVDTLIGLAVLSALVCYVAFVGSVTTGRFQPLTWARDVSNASAWGINVALDWLVREVAMVPVKVAIWAVAAFFLGMLWLLPAFLVVSPVAVWALRYLKLSAVCPSAPVPVANLLDFATVPLLSLYVVLHFNLLAAYHTPLIYLNVYIALTSVLDLAPLRSLLSGLAYLEDLLRNGGLDALNASKASPTEQAEATVMQLELELLRKKVELMEKEKKGQ
ncbi:hypothetical protein JCM10213_008039 [Rhodosporidiobolus nylandii]